MKLPMACHLYAVGERVSLDAPMRRSADRNDVFVVKMCMPHVGTQLQYRIRTEGEAYDRVITEETLTRVPIVRFG